MNKIKIIVKNILLHTVFKLKYANMYNKYKKNNLKQYILFGIPEHGNIGDHAIAIAERKFLTDIGITNVFEVPIKKQRIIVNKIKKSINKDDIVFITGGGFIGDTWMEEEKMVREVISTFKNNKIIIFPSTIYYRNNPEAKKEFEKSLQIYNEHRNIVICARERYTYDFINENYKNVKVLLVPDIVLYLYGDIINKDNMKRENILFCLRKDVEKNISNEHIEKLKNNIYNNININNTDTVINQRITNIERIQHFEAKLNEFAKHKIVVTDRLHGMIFAAITETPCIAIGNYNYKVKGVYEWIKDLEYIYFVDDIDTAEEKIKELLKDRYKVNKINLKECYNDLIKEIEGATY